MTDQPILATLTGEFFQPVRLHYRVLKPERLLPTFRKLRCLNQDPPRQRWVWLYDHEAKEIRFKRSYAQFPKHLRPIVIGSFFPRSQDGLLLDLRSCERATAAIVFFDKHLPRTVAKVTDAEVVNKLFAEAGNERLTPDRLFDRQASTNVDPEALVQRMIDLTADVQDPQEKIRIALEESQSRAKQRLPEIERFPLYYYEEGIESFETTLRLRQIVALQHWLGNSSYSMFDAIQSMVNSR